MDGNNFDLTKRTNQRTVLPQAIQNRNIRSLSFDKAQGGTLTLGGLNNVDGIMQVKDSAGTVKVTVDKDGIAVTDGKISINNTSGISVIDSSGINSINNFRTDQATGFSAGITSISSTYADIPGSTMSSFTLTRATNVLIYFSMHGYCTSTASASQVQFVDNSTQLQNLSMIGDWTAGISVTTNNYLDGTGTPRTYVTAVSLTNTVFAEFAFFQQFVQLAAGSHQFKLQHRNITGTGTAGLNDWLIGYIIYGN